MTITTSIIEGEEVEITFSSQSPGLIYWGATINGERVARGVSQALTTERAAVEIKEKIALAIRLREDVRHPVQPLLIARHGTVHFKENAIIRYLLDAGPFDLNHLACIPFSIEDRVQFAQLIGYSLAGFGELSYVSDADYERAAAQTPREVK